MTYFLPAFTGAILKIPFWAQPPDEDCYDDSVYWEVLCSVLRMHMMTILGKALPSTCLDVCVTSLGQNWLSSPLIERN